MADFVQTMKDWRRMCQHMDKIGGDRCCDICPLGGCNAVYEEDGNTDYAEIEEKVTAWAAEHPEPVYPTWAEFLHEAFCERYTMPYRGETAWYAFLRQTTIPADIAEKLGIEMKE